MPSGTEKINSVESLQDLAIAAKVNGDTLVWDEVTNKWKNVPRTRSIEIEVGDLSDTGTQICPLPGVAGTITGIRLVNGTSVATDNTDYWTFAAVNKGAGTGTTPVLGTAASNTTKATGGAALTNYVARALVLHGTAANLDYAANDALLFTATKSGSATALTKIKLRIDVTLKP